MHLDICTSRPCVYKYCKCVRKRNNLHRRNYQSYSWSPLRRDSEQTWVPISRPTGEVECHAGGVTVRRACVVWRVWPATAYDAKRRPDRRPPGNTTCPSSTRTTTDDARRCTPLRQEMRIMYPHFLTNADKFFYTRLKKVPKFDKLIYREGVVA